MAKISDEILNNIFTLQRKLLELIDEAKAVELSLFERFGETELERVYKKLKETGICYEQPR